MISVNIKDAHGGGTSARVTSIGELVVAPISYSDVSTKTLDVDNTPVNFYPPLAGQQFVITSIHLNANKSVTQDCLVEIYEATGIDITAVAKSILSIEMTTNSFRDIPSLNLLVSKGVFINGRTDDDDVFTSILGYYIPIIT